MAITENVLEQEPPAIEQRAESIGSERLDRSNLGILVTGIIGGGEVSIGALASMTVLGATLDAFPTVGLHTGLALAGLVFPVGFLHHGPLRAVH